MTDRFPLCCPEHVRAAWVIVNSPGVAATAGERDFLRAKIRDAADWYGVRLPGSQGPVPLQIVMRDE